MLQGIHWSFPNNGSEADTEELAKINPSSNFPDFHGFKNTPNRFENRFHHSFIIHVHP